MTMCSRRCGVGKRLFYVSHMTGYDALLLLLLFFFYSTSHYDVLRLYDYYFLCIRHDYTRRDDVFQNIDTYILLIAT